MGLYTQLMSEYLPTAPDRAWLYSACDSNYDGNGKLIIWMADQQRCPQAAALAMYWYLGAGWYGQYAARGDVPGYEQDTYDLVQRLQTRYLSGFYAPGDIGFDPRNDPSPIGSLDEPGLDWITLYESGVNVPEAMKQPVPGPNLGTLDMPLGWTEGMPPHIAALVFSDADDADEEDEDEDLEED